MDDDRSVGKRTTVVIFGRRIMGMVYLMSGVLAMILMLPFWLKLPAWTLAIPLFYLLLHINTWRTLVRSTGAALNPVLGATARNLLIFSLMLLACVVIMIVC